MYFSRMRYSAADCISSKTFCLLCFMPPMCHDSPYSDPPRKLAHAIMPPKFFTKRRRLTEKCGVSATLKPVIAFYDKCAKNTSVTIENCWIRTIFNHILIRNYEHWHLKKLMNIQIVLSSPLSYPYFQKRLAQH